MITGSHGLVFSKDGKQMLLVKRRDVRVWVCPGGAVEKGEKPESAAVRETEEESGYQVKVKRMIGKYTRDNGKVEGVYECELVGGQARTSNESVDVQFFATDQLPYLRAPTVSVWLSDAQKKQEKPIEGKFPHVTNRFLLSVYLHHPNVMVRHLALKWFGVHLS